MTSIAIITAGNNENAKLANNILEEIERNNMITDYINLIDIDLPIYTSTYEQNWGVPEKAIEIHARIKGASGIFFVTPEYNGGIPPVLTNLFAWMSRIGDDWRITLNNKPAAMATHSGNNGIAVLSSLRSQLSFMGMDVIGRQIITTYDKKLNIQLRDEVIKKLIQYCEVKNAR